MKNIIILFLLSIIGCTSKKLSKTTAANNSEQAFTFFVLGDWGMKGTAYQLPVAKQMIAKSNLCNLSMLVTVGDNFYEAGVESTSDEHWKLSYENVYKELTKKYPWYVSLGNHDYRGNIEAEIAYHTVNANWNMPAQYYTFVKETPTHKKIRFVVIDTSPYAADYYSDEKYKSKVIKQDTSKQTHWVDSVLYKATEDWKIVIGHHPLFSSKNAPGQTEALRRAMQPIFDKYKVDAYICGHEHVMEFNQPTTSTVNYIISGGGAKPSKKQVKKEFTKFSSALPAFSIFTVTDKQLAFNFIDSTGKSIYQHVINK